MRSLAAFYDTGGQDLGLKKFLNHVAEDELCHYHVMRVSAVALKFLREIFTINIVILKFPFHQDVVVSDLNQIC